MSWEDQGRQEHGWFGNGTAPERPRDAAADHARFTAGGLGERINAVATGAVAALPVALRRRAEGQFAAGGLSRLSQSMAAWNEGSLLPAGEFAERFFGRTADDAVAQSLRTAATGAAAAKSHAELSAAALALAQAMQSVGLDRWPAFLADAQAHASKPETRTAMATSQRLAQLRQDAIKPAYPVETLPGVAASGLVGGAVGAGRAALGAMVRQATPEDVGGNVAPPAEGVGSGQPPKGNEMPRGPEQTRDIVAPGGRPVGAWMGSAKSSTRTVSPALFHDMKAKLLQGATRVSKPGYDGQWYERPDGSGFGLRTSKEYGETIDIRDRPFFPKGLKVHQR